MSKSFVTLSQLRFFLLFRHTKTRKLLGRIRWLFRKTRRPFRKIRRLLRKIRRLLRKIRRLLRKIRRLLRKIRRLLSKFWRLLKIGESEREGNFALTQIREAWQEKTANGP